MSHYEPYSAYKNSGVEWMGKVPEHWPVKSLKTIATLSTGATPPTDNPLNYSDDEVYPWFRPEDLDESGAPSKASKYLSEIGWGLSRRVKAGASLICCIGTIGKVGYLNKAASTNQQITAVKFDSTDRYFFYAIVAARQVLDACAVGNVIRILNSDRLGAVFLPYPSVAERLIIAAHLDRETARIDALVEKKTRFIKLLKEKRQALITHAVTKGLDANVKMKDSGVEWLGNVPEHWEVKRLKFIADVQTGVAKGKDNTGQLTIEVPYLRVANVQDGYLSLEDVATIKIPPGDLKRYRLQSGDVLMNEGGDFDKLGRGHVWQGEIDPCIHQNHVFAVRPREVDSWWLNTFTGSTPAQFYFMVRSKQSTNLASISSSNVMELPVPVPPSQERVAILTCLDRETKRIDTLIQKTDISITLLKERRSALITAAVTGQIDLQETS